MDGNRNMELQIRRRLNKTVGDQVYWKWYVDIPSPLVKKLGLKIGDTVKVSKVG